MNVPCSMNNDDIIDQFQRHGHSGLPTALRTQHTVPIDTRTDLAIWDGDGGKVTVVVCHFFRGTQSRPGIDKYVKGLGAHRVHWNQHRLTYTCDVGNVDGTSG